MLKKTFNFFQKIFDKTIRSCYHIQVSGKQPGQNSIRPDGQAVKTTPSHGVNPGSIPGQVIKKQADICLLFCCLFVTVPPVTFIFTSHTVFIDFFPTMRYSKKCITY